EQVRLVADEKGFRLHCFVEELSNVEAIVCLVGPPGGFSPDELKAIQKHGYRPVWLSANRLRTELAGVVLTASLLSMVGPRT
ncbi:MAG: hypothetical protein GF344_16735, partial [Chitinivibrionales bacterium]|nr:hypothetical protein [Chitinivibrionales bacterium]MBD3358337.1 hypothetical protein [Chitinivibrionales bacterium]